MRLLETHTCQGAAYSGYVRAGLDVTGVDIEPNHAKYHPGLFILADAATYIINHGRNYDAIHASPPCQFYTRGNAMNWQDGSSPWPRSIPEIRDALETTGKPYVIENVKDATWDMIDPVTLCGCMFDLGTTDDDGIYIHMLRPRFFEVSGFTLTAPRECDHSGKEWIAGAYGGARRDKYEAKYIRKGGYVPPNKDVVKALLGIDPLHNMTWNGVFESVPPAYTEWIGQQMRAQLS